MPQPFINAVMTNAGAEILTRSQAGEGAVVFTRIVTGDGVYEDSEKNIAVLQGITELRNAKNSYRPSGIEKVNEFTVKVTALLSNVDPVSHKTLVTESYHINEMGLYAKIAGDDADVLYSVTVVSSAIGDLMPPYNGDNPAQIIQGWVATISNTAEVSVELPAGAVALVTDLQATNREVHKNRQLIEMNATNILALDVAVTMLQGAVVAGTTENIYVETFLNDSDITVEEGIYDSSNKRLYA